MDSSDRGGGRASLGLKASEGVCGMHAFFGGIQRQSSELLANFSGKNVSKFFGEVFPEDFFRKKFLGGGSLWLDGFQ